MLRVFFVAFEDDIFVRFTLLKVFTNRICTLLWFSGLYFTFVLYVRVNMCQMNDAKGKGTGEEASDVQVSV